MVRFSRSQLQLRILPLSCLTVFHPAVSSPSPPRVSCPPSSHSLSGRAICEGPVRHSSAPAEASSSSGYDSEWISISSGCSKRMGSCALLHAPALRVPLAGVAASTASWVGGALTYSLSAWQASHAHWCLGLQRENDHAIQISTPTLRVRDSLNSRMRVGFP